MSKWLAAAAALAVALPLALVLLVTATRSAGPGEHGPGRRPERPGPGHHPARLPDALPRRRPDLPRPALGRPGRHRQGRKRSRPVHRPRRALRRELRRGRGPDAVRAGHLRPVRGQRRPRPPSSPRTTRRTRSTPPPRCCARTAPPPAPSAGIRQAIYAYNHAQAYVTDVLAWAARYTVPAPSSAAAAAIAFAVRQVGKPYQWGATGPDAYDCSGLVYAAYAAAGIHIARTTYQWRQDGPQIPLTQIQPGDLLFSAGSDGTPANPGHVVMYLGGGQIIQAPQTGEDVQIDPLDLAGVVVATRPADLPRMPDPQPGRRTPMIRVTIAQLRATTTVDLMTAAAALGLGRTKAYELARRGAVPLPGHPHRRGLPRPHRRPAGTPRRRRRRTAQPGALHPPLTRRS